MSSASGVAPVSYALSGEPFVLRLYVAGETPKSLLAFANLREICETHLAGRYELEVIDIREHARLDEGERIVAAPTLIKELPLPVRMLIGDMSDRERVLLGIDLVAGQT